MKHPTRLQIILALLGYNEDLPHYKKESLLNEITHLAAFNNDAELELEADEMFQNLPSVKSKRVKQDEPIEQQIDGVDAHVITTQ